MVHYLYSALVKYTLALDGLGCSSSNNIYISVGGFASMDVRVSQFDKRKMMLRGKPCHHRLSCDQQTDRRRGGQFLILDAYVGQAGVTRGEQSAWYSKGISIHPLSILSILSPAS